MASEYYIGIMSGTSLDGTDTALVEFDNQGGFSVIETQFSPYSSNIKNALFSLFTPGNTEIDRMGQLSQQLGVYFGDAVNSILERTNIAANKISAIGSHGQTIRHRPDLPSPFTLQIGDPSTIAHTTGITTVADFRSRDIASGGQGAPLAPAFHHSAFHSPAEDRVIVNIGGIANITYVPAAPNTNSQGFDTGPGNGLMDLWCKKHISAEFDHNGDWAKSGAVIKPLLNTLLSYEYFSRTPPKSTGKEMFNEAWLTPYLQAHLTAAPADVQATLLELTAVSLAKAIDTHCSRVDAIYVCGGGALNQQLMKRIATLTTAPTQSTSALGADPLWVEAIAFAWLAKQTRHNQTGNLPSSTGAKQASILGGIYPGKNGI